MRVVYSALIAAVVAACSAEDAAVATATVSDSGGVRIVVNAAGSLPSWDFDSVPLMTIGSPSGENGQDLSLPWSSLRLPDGRVAISNARTNELRLYSSEGEYLRAAGGPGDGPGEFRFIGRLHRLSSDSILAADAVQPRLTVFNIDGQYARTLPVQPLESGMPTLRGILEDTVGVWGVTVYERSGGVTKGVREQLVVGVRAMSGGASAVVAQVPAAEKFNQVMPHGGVIGWNQPFSRNAFTAVGGGQIWVGHSDHYEVRAYDSTGRLKTVLRLDRPPAPVGDSERARYFEHELSKLDPNESRDEYVAVHRIITIPETMPAYSALVVDVEGNLWVRDYQAPWESGPVTWRIFAPDGRGRAMMHLPSDLVVHDVGSSYILGMVRDELDVEYVKLYTFRKSAGE